MMERAELGQFSGSLKVVVAFQSIILFLSGRDQPIFLLFSSAEECKQVCWALRDFTRLFR